MYNVPGGDDIFTGVRFTGRLNGGPLGIMTIAEQTIVDGTNPIFTDGNTGRFGDYSHLAVDLIDERTFWGTTEYVGAAPSNASTRVFSFQLERLNNDLTVDAIINPKSSGLGNEETVTVSILNRGSLPVENFSLQLLQDGVEVVTFNITESLASEDHLDVTFEQNLDLSEIRDYELTVNITYEGDENLNNNSFSETITNLATPDIALEVTFQNSSYCTNNEC